MKTSWYQNGNHFKPSITDDDPPSVIVALHERITELLQHSREAEVHILVDNKKLILDRISYKLHFSSEESKG